MHSLEHAITAWDRAAFLAINHGLKCPLLDFLMPRISDLGLGHVAVLALLCVALWRGGRAIGLRWRTFVPGVPKALASQRSWLVPMLIAFAISGIASTVVKTVTERDRPWWFYHNEHQIGRDLDVHVFLTRRPPMRVRGFPSGHTATTVALAVTSTLLLIRRRGPMRSGMLLAGIWMLTGLISLSRIYIADHWPIDAICGAMLGVVAGLAAPEVYRAWVHRRAVAAKSLTTGPLPDALAGASGGDTVKRMKAEG